jgi:hypothetical protein
MHIHNKHPPICLYTEPPQGRVAKKWQAKENRPKTITSMEIAEKKNATTQSAAA